MMSDKTKIFFCEDDESLGLMLKEYLEAKGYEADLFVDGEEGLRNFSAKEYNICLLDVMMPRKDGFTLAQEIREINPDVPIIFVTALNQKDDVLKGFTLGGDDYITKPFSIQELQMRIEAILKRVQKKQPEIRAFYQLGKYFFDTQQQTLTIDGKVTRLTTKESELLALLCANSNQTLERNHALKSIWIDDNYFNARSMDVYITKLRKLLKGDPQLEIKNVHGKGYRLNTPLAEITDDMVEHV